MRYLKNKAASRIIIFFIILMMVFWMLPGGVVFGQEDTSTPTSESVNPPAAQDTTLPIITLNGENPVFVSAGASYTDAGASAIDDVDGDISSAIISAGAVDMAVPGTYTVTYSVSDAAGNVATSDRIINVVETLDTTPPTETTPESAGTTTDQIPPVISLTGDEIVALEIGSEYIDAGATAVDDVDGDITSFVITKNTVGTDAAGSYTVTYNASDAAGNAAVEVLRTVKVILLGEKPVATLNSYLPDPTNDSTPGFSGSVMGAKDIFSIEYRVGGVDGIWVPVDSFTVGPNPDFTFTTPVMSDGFATIEVRAIDREGNKSAIASDTLTIDTQSPEITLLGKNPTIIEVGSTYIDVGATAVDSIVSTIDDDLAGAVDLTSVITSTSTVDTSTVGSYKVTYNVSDAAGNAATKVTRIVNVFNKATIATSKLDYIPDDYVLVTGSGWLPGETVKLDFHETLFDPIFQQTTAYYTVADSEGKINDIQYIIELRHLGASFTLTATGMTSGLTAQTTFTDGIITSTATGGAWATGATWVGGAVPAAGDTVVIATTGSNSVNIGANIVQSAAGSVTVNNGATLDLTGGTVTLGALTINSGGTVIANRQLTVLGATNITGTINFGSTSTTIRSMTFTGAVTLNSGAVWNETNTLAAATFKFGSSFINNASTFTAQNSEHIFNGTSVTISGATITSIPFVTISGTTTNNGTLTVSTTLKGAGPLTNAETLNIGGTCSITTLTNSGTASITGTGTITTALAKFINTGTLNLGGSGTITGITNNAGGIVNQNASATITSFNNATSTSTLNISTTPTVPAFTTLTVSASGNTVNYNGLGAQTVKIVAYSNLILSGSGVKTFTVTTVNKDLTLSGSATVTTGANLAIAGNLDIGTGTVFTTDANWTLGVTDNTSVTGTLKLEGTGAKIFTGDVTINSDGVWNETGIAAINFAGNLTNNATTFTANTGTHTFSGATKTLNGATATSIPTVTFTDNYSSNGTLTVGTLMTVTGVGIRLTNNGTITASTALSGTGGVTQGTTGILNIGGTSGINTLIATAAGNTVNYNGSGTQTIRAINYYNLTSNSNGTRVLESTEAIGVSGTFTTGTNTYTVTGSTISFNGSSIQNIPVFTFNGLTLSNPSGATLTGTGDRSVGGLLTLTSGNITTDANTLIIKSTGSITGGSSSSYVNGNLQKAFAAGNNQLFTFPIGDDTNYTPIALASLNVGTAGNLTARTNFGDFGNIDSSSIDSTKSINRYWTLTAGEGLAVSNYDATFYFVSGDVDSGADTGNFIVGKYYSGWTYPTVGTKTTTSTQVTGLNSFSDFVVGETAITSAAPTAANIAISGTAQVGQTLTGSYTYFDINGNTESGSTYRWLANTGTAGAYEPIGLATGLTYVIDSSLVGKTIKFEVTPKTIIEPATGDPVQSDPTAEVAKYGQTITFSVLSDKAYGDSDFSVIATASSGLPVTFTASGNCTVSNSGTITTAHITGAGACTITAHQEGNESYDAAIDVGQTFNVAKANLLITASGSAKTYGQATVFDGTEFSASGLTNSDTVTSVFLSSTGSPEAAPVGDYAIIASSPEGSGLENYSISYTDGNLNVGRAFLTITADNASRIFGIPNPVFTGIITGMQSEDNISTTYASPATITSLPGEYSIVPILVDPDERLANFDLTINNGTMTIVEATGFLRILELDSTTGLPIQGAEYWVYNPSGVHVETLITGPDGGVTVSGFKWGTYTVVENSAPAGYQVDPTAYTIVFGANSNSVILNVTNSPAGAGGQAAAGITVAGITEGGIQVLAFTGIDPIIPVSGGSALVAGLAMLMASIRRRNLNKWSHSQKDK